MKNIILHLALALVLAPLALAQDAFVTDEQAPKAPGGGGDITDSLRAWWKFDDGSGTTAVDNEGNTYPGTLEGSTIPTWTTGHIDGGLDFPDTDSSVNFGGSLLGTGDKSVSCWINFDNLPGAVCGVLADSKFAMGVNSGGAVVVTGDGGVTTANGAASITTASWHFICATVTSAGTCNIYVNGALSGTANQATGTPSTSAFNFEAGSSVSAIGGDYKMDDVRIYDRILSAAEVDQIWDFFP